MFVCAGNTGRSVSAETLARLYLEAHGLAAVVFSRGLAVDPNHLDVEEPARVLFSRRGVDLSRRLAQSLEARDVEKADLILCATREHRDQIITRFPAARLRAFSLAQYSGVGADLEDAFGKSASTYEAMLRQLELQIPAAVARALAEFESEPH